MSFNSLGLSSNLENLLVAKYYTLASDIQLRAIPEILKGNDVIGISETGSGKTMAYVLPLLMNFNKQLILNDRFVDTLILVPTRELAVQVKNVFDSFSSALPKRIKTLAVYGGASINPQMIAMQGVNILVATPGRLLELVKCNAVQLAKVKQLVFDEADKLLNASFKVEIDEILGLLPSVRQNLLFSATFKSDVDSLVKEVGLHNPVVIDISAAEVDIERIKQIAYLVREEEKGPYLRQLIVSKKMEQVLVFASSTHQVDAVVNKLTKNKINARALHSKKSQGARTEALNLFKNKKIQVLVATDLMGRGIDIKELPFVINYELPRSPKDYIHRIGRTGRADAKGEAINLLTHHELQHFGVIQKKMGKQVEIVDIHR